MTILQILWFFLIFVLIAGYFVLDGFDLDAGVLYPVLGRCVVRGISRGVRHDVLGLLPCGDARALRAYRTRRFARIPRP